MKERKSIYSVTIAALFLIGPIFLGLYMPLQNIISFDLFDPMPIFMIASALYFILLILRVFEIDREEKAALASSQG